MVDTDQYVFAHLVSGSEISYAGSMAPVTASVQAPGWFESMQAGRWYRDDYRHLLALTGDESPLPQVARAKWFLDRE